MIKVFLVEDEMVIRNAIKNSIDWEKEGYEFVGEAGDGELAYPLILKRQPDILITDIKMPFMDGLELSAAVKKELPALKILILSGYNDFEYAKTAIGIGVTDYLLKPVSAEMLLESLAGIREMIQKESQNKELLRKYEEEMQENFEKQKTEVLGKLITGRFSTMEALDLGKSIGLDVSAAYSMKRYRIISIWRVKASRTSGMMWCARSKTPSPSV
ncbi:YesN/AraC family two-component response regulator [Lachnospiraceae bacterium PM6-15]|uniref:response regulator n=1 Tax=Ohessyouella blattaphilus TaxID=2949333 RepID=UPI003E222BCE